MKKCKKIMSLMLVATITLSMALVTGCKKEESKSKDKLDNVIVSVDKTDIKLKDAMYYIYNTEAMGEYYDQMYLQYTGSGYWDATDDSGETNRQKAKDYVMDNVVMIDILSKKAAEAKLEVTDDDIKKNKETVTSLLKNVTDEQLKITGFTEKNLLEILNKVSLAGKYYDQMVKGFKIDEDAIKATVDKAKFRQYNTDYILFPTKKADESGNAVALSDKEKQQALANAQEALTSLKAGKSFDDLKTKYTDATTDSNNFIESDENVDAAYKKAALKLKKDELSGVVEGTDGYYVIKMTDNNSTERYDTEVQNAISTETNTQFTKAYDELKKNYKVTVNDKVWDSIVMGKVTVVKDTTAAGSSTTGSSSTGASTTEDSSTGTTTSGDSGASTDSTTTDSGTSNGK